jgi:hypothetical protein
LHGFRLEAFEIVYHSQDHTDPSRKNVEKSWMPNDKNALYMSTGDNMEEACLHTIVADFHRFPREETGFRTRGFTVV